MKALLTIVAAVALLAASGAAARNAQLTVTITSGPEGTVSDTTATLAFAADARAAEFLCSLDGADASPCSSPITYRGLADGVHAFEVTAALGRERASASRRWRIDTTPLPPPPTAPPPPPTAPPPPPAPSPPPAESPNPSPTETASDTDGDGVEPAKDSCPTTPQAARPLVLGCSAVEIVGHPERFLQPLDRALDDAIARLRKTTARDKTGLAASLRAARGAYDPALAHVADARVCLGAGEAEAATRRLEAVGAGIHGKIADAQSQLLRRARGGGDADETDLAWHDLAYAAQRVDAAVRAGSDGDDAFRAACQDVTGRLGGTKRVSGTDDAAHLVEFEDGLVASRSGREDAWVGGRARLDGVRFKDGTAAVDKLDYVAGEHGKLGGITVDCTLLRIAPIQPFDPPNELANDTYVLHKPAGYTWSGVLLLEDGMRFAAEAGKCPTTTDGPHIRRYSVTLRLTYNKYGTVAVIASDMDASDAPVDLPGNFDLNYPAELDVIQRYQVCTPIVGPGGGAASCGAPVAYATGTYYLGVHKRGWYASADYSRTGFDLENADEDDFRTAFVTTLGFTGPPSAANPAFHADGYSASGNGQVVDIETNEPFAVYRDDFFDPENQILDAADAFTGVDHAAALKWPRIEGVHNGAPFRYSVTLPRIARDVINLCSPGPDAYYRPPWEHGGVHKVTQGNNNPFTHIGPGKYAFDFSLADGETIYAARRGTVKYVEESLSKTSDPNKVKAGLQQAEPANALYIEHDDGTESRYFHMQKDGVFVSKGQTVKRGQPVATTGNTGNSTDAHLHFQVNNPSIEIRFEAIRIQGFSGILETCTIPLEGRDYYSTNTQP